MIKLEIPTEITIAVDPDTAKQNYQTLLAIRQKVYEATNIINSLILANQAICRHARIKSDICQDCGKNLE